MVRIIYYLALNLHKQAQCPGMKINNAHQFSVLLYILKHVQASQLFHPQVSLPLVSIQCYSSQFKIGDGGITSICT